MVSYFSCHCFLIADINLRIPVPGDLHPDSNNGEDNAKQEGLLEDGPLLGTRRLVERILFAGVAGSPSRRAVQSCWEGEK